MTDLRNMTQQTSGSFDNLDADSFLESDTNMDTSDDAITTHLENGSNPDDDMNRVRSFSMYKVLERPLRSFLTEGDGINALPVFEEEYHPDADMIDASLINMIKFISTAFGRSRIPQAFKIVERIHMDNSKKRTFRFRSKHPLYTDGTPRYQNVCLVSGMVYLGIPILPYFDGVNVLEPKDDPNAYLQILRSENSDLF